MAETTVYPILRYRRLFYIYETDAFEPELPTVKWALWIIT